MNNEEKIWQHVDARREAYIGLADRVWGMPEIAYNEYKSTAEHKAMLEAEGFRVHTDLAGIPTAIMGEAGEEGPVIAILGEYDALPDLSQEAGVAEPRPLAGDGMGHGCGHNLLGSAALLAATGLKNWLAETGLPGRVCYYGCPAEEGGAANKRRAAPAARRQEGGPTRARPRRQEGRCRAPGRVQAEEDRGGGSGEVCRCRRRPVDWPWVHRPPSLR